METDSKSDLGAIVLYGCKTKATDEHGLKVGKVVTDIIMVEESWGKGRLNECSLEVL